MKPANELAVPVRKQRPRLLMLAYCFDMNGSMEDRNGWQRAVLAAEEFDVTVMYSPTVPVNELLANVPSHLPTSSIRFEPIEVHWIAGFLKRLEICFAVHYRAWHRLAYRKAKMLHTENPFQVSHLVTICGFREPGHVWQLDIPHVWGPLGGTHDFPKEFMGSLDIWNQVREKIRTAINRYQLNFCSRIRRAQQKSIVIAATAGAQSDLRLGSGLDPEIEIETGIDHTIDLPRTSHSGGRPLRLLWAGRLRAWKALPLLLHAIAQLPKTTDVRLRVLGDGSCKAEWKNLAMKLGIADKIEWHAWPTYAETLPHYKWADLFTFTSLRDTSGTGLLEALAAGCPIIGVNHQGAADVMTNQCSIGVSVSDWDTTVAGFRDGIERLANDSEEWLRLSHGATERASDYVWKTRSAAVFRAYRSIIAKENKEQYPAGNRITPQATVRSFEDDFYASTVLKLVERGRISTSDSVLVTAGGMRDQETWLACGFRNVTISNLDDRMIGNEFAPFAWSFQDAEKITLKDNSVDFVCIHAGLHHCGCPQAAILEMLRVARKGILLFEPYDNLVTRLGLRLGLGQRYETAAVYYNDFTHGGMRNGPVANYVYRFTKWELEKTVSTAYPEGPVDLEFVHALRVPWDQLKGRRNKIPYFLACLASPFLNLASFLVPEQGNGFAAFIAKRNDASPVWPWVARSTNGSCSANREWLSQQYKKQ